MDQLAAVAAAHLLALLVPGVDFFLVARSAMTSGWRTATGACVGIAVANGLLITAAFVGLSVFSHPGVLAVVQVAGGAFLVVVGVAFLRSREHVDLDGAPRATRATWTGHVGLGLGSGLLNPKNALFYVSLAAAVAPSPPMTLLGYGLWMFTVVLVWDVVVAVALGSRRALARMERLLPWLSRIAGIFLVLFGVGMVVEVAGRWRPV
ncbi:LysE family translocator [Pseudokineococcus sp. 1T1Z-3]|uniref:LysE family translocator n=1 Tax=Pseudokineococcus sp. 1T1Z-3 TaxID=3132745 RepID=UPI0030B3FA36